MTLARRGGDDDRRKDRFGNTVVERPVRPGDLERLEAWSGRTQPAREGIAKAEIEGSKIEVTWCDGWKEEIEFGRYELKDPSNRTVEERPATAADRARLEAAAGF